MVNKHALHFTGHLSGNKVLDFGCGPTIKGVISASKWYNEIYLSDYTPKCREEVQKWLDRDSDAFNWQPYLAEYSKLEGYVHLQSM